MDKCAPFEFRSLNRKFSILMRHEDDHISKALLTSRNFYEYKLLLYIKLMRIKGDCAIDVGANIGNHSIFFGNFICEKIISVEPNEDLIDTLSSNLRNNNCNYQTIFKGLGKLPSRGTLKFPAKNNIGAARIEVGSGAIEIDTLDNIAPTSGVCLVKVDVEGMELDVLMGGSQLLKIQHPDLIVEAAAPHELIKISDYLLRLGYEPLARWNATPTYHFSYRPSLIKILYAKIIRLLIRSLI